MCKLFGKLLTFHVQLKVTGTLLNTGRGLVFRVNQNKSVIFTGGPLSYQYKLTEMVLHYGRQDERGSEHTISGRQFPAEIQLYAFNSQLFTNWSTAQHEPNGILGIGIFISQPKEAHQSNKQLKTFIHAVKNVTNKGKRM